MNFNIASSVYYLFNHSVSDEERNEIKKIFEGKAYNVKIIARSYAKTLIENTLSGTNANASIEGSIFTYTRVFGLRELRRVSFEDGYRTLSTALAEAVISQKLDDKTIIEAISEVLGMPAQKTDLGFVWDLTTAT